MKKGFGIVWIAALLLAVHPPCQAAAEGAPSAVVHEARYAFEPVMEGKSVVHDFVVENQGTASLEILNIKTGCGCTTADFTRTIPPGEKGNITIKANTQGYGGHVFDRHITVSTNDPQKKTIDLYMQGKVEKFADIQPPTAVLAGPSNDAVETQVTVRVAKNHPFKVMDVHADKTLDGKIEYSLITLENGYVLRIKNKQQAPGHYFGRIFLKTDNPDKPEIAIPVTGRIG